MFAEWFFEGFIFHSLSFSRYFAVVLEWFLLLHKLQQLNSNYLLLLFEIAPSDDQEIKQSRLQRAEIIFISANASRK